MKIIRTVTQMQILANRLRSKGRIGFVPTMGYLHQGHLSLIKKSKKETDFTIVSIFVNPTQFGPKEDFAKYPKDFKRDIKILKPFCIDALFYPSIKQMYPQGFSTYVNVEKLSHVFEGSIRQGHFKGVATVITKLFNIVKPDIAYFGQKDAQQCAIIKRVAKDLNMDIKIRICPTIREKCGLAMSSRNVYLSSTEHQKSLCIYDSLSIAKNMVKQGIKDCKTIKSAIAKRILMEDNVDVQYIDIVEPDSFKSLSVVQKPCLAIVAVRIGNIRLIDNMFLE
jgi:pantoate--beta-alanine ligase